MTVYLLIFPTCFTQIFTNVGLFFQEYLLKALAGFTPEYYKNCNINTHNSIIQCFKIILRLNETAADVSIVKTFYDKSNINTNTNTNNTNNNDNMISTVCPMVDMSVFLGGKYLNLYAYLLKRRNHIPINPKLAPNKSTQKPRAEPVPETGPGSISNHGTAESKQQTVNGRQSSAANILARVGGGGGGQAEASRTPSSTATSHTSVTSPIAPTAASTTTPASPAASTAVAPTASTPARTVDPSYVLEQLVPVPTVPTAEVATVGVAKFTIPTITTDTTTDSNPPSVNTLDHIVNTVQQTTLQDTTVGEKEDVQLSVPTPSTTAKDDVVSDSTKGKVIYMPVLMYRKLLYYITYNCILPYNSYTYDVVIVYTQKRLDWPFLPHLPLQLLELSAHSTATVLLIPVLSVISSKRQVQSSSRTLFQPPTRPRVSAVALLAKPLLLPPPQLLPKLPLLLLSQLLPLQQQE